MFAWTQEDRDTLRTMWLAGSTSTEISQAIGSISRSAVMGMVNRMGLMRSEQHTSGLVAAGRGPTGVRRNDSVRSKARKAEVVLADVDGAQADSHVPLEASGAPALIDTVEAALERTAETVPPTAEIILEAVEVDAVPAAPEEPGLQEPTPEIVAEESVAPTDATQAEPEASVDVDVSVVTILEPEAAIEAPPAEIVEHISQAVDDDETEDAVDDDETEDAVDDDDEDDHQTGETADDGDDEDDDDQIDDSDDPRRAPVRAKRDRTKTTAASTAAAVAMSERLALIRSSALRWQAKSRATRVSTAPKSVPKLPEISISGGVMASLASYPTGAASCDDAFAALERLTGVPFDERIAGHMPALVAIATVMLKGDPRTILSPRLPQQPVLRMMRAFAERGLVVAGKPTERWLTNVDDHAFYTDMEAIRA